MQKTQKKYTIHTYILKLFNIYLGQLIHVALANILNDHGVSVPKPKAYNAEYMAGGHADEQLVLLSHVIQYLGLRLPEIQQTSLEKK